MSKRQQFLLWIAAALFATAGLVAVLVWEHRPPSTRHALYVIGIPEEGAALFYGEKHCSTCHSVNGSGGRLAPDLGGTHPGTPALGWLTTVLWNHAPGMWRQMRKGYSPHLNQEEMAHILSFLYQASTLDRPGDPAAGKRVFEAKGCVRCHSVRNSGSNHAPELSQVAATGDAIGWMQAMWNHAQSMIAPVAQEIGQWPQFKGSEMNDLLAYVNGGAPGTKTVAAKESALRGSAEHGWQVFQARCMQCHAVHGKGGNIGPELGPDHDLPQSPAQFATVLWNHAPAMLRQARQAGMQPPTLEGDEIKDILKFLISLRYFEPTGSTFLGERIFTERGCARCHGHKAEGSRTAPQLRAGVDAFTTVSLATALWSHGPAMSVRADQMGIPWPNLEPADIGHLISFLNDPARKK